MTFVCSGPSAPDEVVRTLVGLAECCIGAVEDGPGSCTCWSPEYDLAQRPVAKVFAPIQTRSAMCDDCAFRPDSPERAGDDRYSHSEDLADLDHFWCHQGIRKPLRWHHRSLGITVEADVDAYDPPQHVVAGETVPFKADGTPADRCAGFAARQR